MSLALFGASTLVLQHKENVTSLLGLSTRDLVYSLGFAGARSVSAAAVLFLQGILLFKGTNPLHNRELHNSGAPLLRVATLRAKKGVGQLPGHDGCPLGLITTHALMQASTWQSWP